jgi:hypothetical protein
MLIMHVVRRRRLNKEAFDREFCFPGAVADAFGRKSSKPLLKNMWLWNFSLHGEPLWNPSQ